MRESEPGGPGPGESEPRMASMLDILAGNAPDARVAPPEAPRPDEAAPPEAAQQSAEAVPPDSGWRIGDLVATRQDANGRPVELFYNGPVAGSPDQVVLSYQDAEGTMRHELIAEADLPAKQPSAESSSAEAPAAEAASPAAEATPPSSDKPPRSPIIDALNG